MSRIFYTKVPDYKVCDKQTICSANSKVNYHLQGRWLLNNFISVLPFKIPMKSDTDTPGGIETIIW